MFDSGQARAAQIKQARRDLMTALLMVYPTPFGFVSIVHSLLHLDLPDTECIKRDLAYLIDKGYVEWTNKKDHMPWDRRYYRLTSKGNEIANRIEIDPALEP